MKVRTSDIDHGLQSLMRAAADLHRGSNATIAWVSDEPSAHVFLFRNATDYVSVDIVLLASETAEDPWKAAERRWSGRIRVEVLTEAVLRMAQAVWDEHGAAGYQRLWDGMAFPEKELLILRGERP
jgi:hypothetical protein